MLFMVIEKFRDGDPKPVYRRFREKDRMAPAGVRYAASWVTTDFERCVQVMDCDDRSLLDEWMSYWNDVAEFADIPVITSEKAKTAIEPHLYDRNYKAKRVRWKGRGTRREEGGNTTPRRYLQPHT